MASSDNVPTTTPSAAPSVQTAAATLAPGHDSTKPSNKRPLQDDATIEPLSSPTKAARLALATFPLLPPLTGAAALEDQRRRDAERQHSPPPTSQNPSHAAITSLMSIDAISRPSDAPILAPAIMDPSPKAVSALTAAANAAARIDDHIVASPESTGPEITESPTPMEVDKGEHADQIAGQESRPALSATSYPGSLHASAHMPEPAARHMSYPDPQMQGSPTPTGSKKHKCPFCQTEFTRHHNLKSHLLTHSQEKPYVCTECQMRFRRLHDLKRHGKLHSGEKPHICPKCDRKFARGDALARHAKGAGGCAGRRSSMGSFADEADLDGSMMDADESTISAVGYGAGDDDAARRQSVPGGGHGSHDQYSVQSRTYPPAGPRPTTTGMYAPQAPSQGSTSAGSSIPNSLTSHATGTSISSTGAANSSANVYSQSGMTESPKALSPVLASHEPPRPRSPANGRRPTDITSPHSASRPKLPGLAQSGFPPPSTNNYGHGRSPGGESGNMFAQSDPSVWAYIQGLEDKIKMLSEKVTSLDQEVVGLKRQLDTRDAVAVAAAAVSAPTV
ncbi:Putative Zinc finger protein 740 [[Torrubiella] hemipterigena]|uniref:Putative Zinc finger protein 740 n=1 Tax=[Torrubiella] hemipterigena TaxID=1531966 RepID=A0A0A1TP66_9HYPO|nr:Putative Zinc finger protein 740 [[Torrubiella] hemipterigena]